MVSGGVKDKALCDVGVRGFSRNSNKCLLSTRVWIIFQVIKFVNFYGEREDHIDKSTIKSKEATPVEDCFGKSRKVAPCPGH